MDAARRRIQDPSPTSRNRGEAVNFFSTIAGWSSQVARRAHNPKVEGSNPSPATKKIFTLARFRVHRRRRRSRYSTPRVCSCLADRLKWFGESLKGAVEDGSSRCFDDGALRRGKPLPRRGARGPWSGVDRPAQAKVSGAFGASCASSAPWPNAGRLLLFWLRRTPRSSRFAP